MKKTEGVSPLSGFAPELAFVNISEFENTQGEVMKVAVIGTGYVGLVSGTCFAEIGHDVTCIDISVEKIQMLKSGKSPIYEPGLNELLERNIKNERLQFSTGMDSVAASKVIFLAVGTPSAADGRANLEYLFAAAKSVAMEMSEGAIVVIKSTVPVGTCHRVREVMAQNTTKKFYVVNNPEFLKEGSAVEDFMRPDRVIIGFEENVAAEAMDELYAPLLRQGNPLYRMSNISAEMSKYAANCFLATKISFINEIARLCDLTGADVEEVRKGISSDKRIGGHFLYPGPGYGGSCFPKDVKALVHTAKDFGMDLKIVDATEEVNREQRVYVLQKIKKHFGENLKGKKFCFWGVAFKANTDDVRESSSISLASALASEGAKVKFYDPVASENFMLAMKEEAPEAVAMLEQSDHMYNALEDCDALLTMTEWREFQNPDFKEVKKRLKTAVIIDGRNLFSTKKVLAEGFDYYAIGKFIPKVKK
jgi:UDPglucose 6-dehydrogenase